MVDVIGHLGMALLWLAPSWYVFDRAKSAGIFIGVCFWFGMLPDVDLVLSNYVASIHHHGIFHTVLVVTLLSVVLGPFVGRVIVKVIRDTEPVPPVVETRSASIGITGVWVAATSHLFADMLSAPDVSQAIEPFWPLYDHQVVVLDVLWYKSLWATVGLLALGIGANVVLGYARSEKG